MFPMGNLGRMHPVRIGSFVGSFEPFERFQRHTSFKLCAILFPLCRHFLSPHLLNEFPLTQQFYLNDLSSFRGTLYLAPVGGSVPHWTHMSIRRVPHSRQNFACGGFSYWHREHCMQGLLSVRPCATTFYHGRSMPRPQHTTKAEPLHRRKAHIPGLDAR